MFSKSVRRMFSTTLVVMMLAPTALAENPSDNVSGYNPFDGTWSEGSAPVSSFDTSGVFDTNTSSVINGFVPSQVTGNPFETNSSTDPFNTGTQATTSADPFGAGTQATTAADPFGTGTQAATSADPFGTGTQAATSTDPFGTGTQATTSTDPFGTGTQATAADPFNTGSQTGAAADPFNTDAQAATASDPFSTGAQTDAASNPFASGTAAPVSTPVPMATVSGYNPFDQSQSAPAIPVNAVMYVSASSVKLRARPANNGKVFATVYFGQELNVAATQGSWAQVQNANGTTGYCEYSALSAVNPNTMSKLMYAQLPTTPVYRAPSQKSGRMRNLKRGDTTTMVAITSDGRWARVSDGTNFGFVPSIYLDDMPAAEGTPVWCLSGSTAVMVNPDGWIQISTLSFGQPCYLVGYVNGNTIAKIRSAKGYVAYCDASALTTVDPATLDSQVIVQASGKVLCTSTADDARRMNVNKNQRFIMLGVDNSQSWALVRQGKRKLYIPFIFLGSASPGNNNKVVVANQDAPLYNGADTTTGTLQTLPLGTRLYLMGGEGQYAKVATVPDGTTASAMGFVPIQYLRNE